MTSEKRVQKFHTDDVSRNAPDWLKQISLPRPIKSTIQMWVVTRHQYGISAHVPQTLFRRETSSGFAKCRVFSQARELLAL